MLTRLLDVTTIAKHAHPKVPVLLEPPVPGQAGEPRRSDSLLLDQHLKFFSQPFGMNEVFQQEPRTQLFDFSLTRLVQVGKLICPAERDQKLRLRDEPCPHEPRPAPPQIHGREIDVSGQILFARRIEKIFRNSMIVVSKEGAAV